MSQPTNTSEANKHDDKEAAKWVLGLLLSGVAWLLWRVWEWLFGPSGPALWWQVLKYCYHGAVLASALYQVYRGVREINRIEKTIPTAKGTAPGEVTVDGTANEGEQPELGHSGERKGLGSWIIHFGAMLVCFVGLALFIAVCLAIGYGVESVKNWFWSLFS